MNEYGVQNQCQDSPPEPEGVRKVIRDVISEKVVPVSRETMVYSNCFWWVVSERASGHGDSEGQHVWAVQSMKTDNLPRFREASTYCQVSQPASDRSTKETLAAGGLRLGCL